MSESSDASQRSGGRAAQKQQTRATILAAARARFVAVGYERATIREIADAAGVAVGTVHAHFKDKQALLFACFFAGIAAALARIWEGHDERAPLLEQLTRCGRVLYEAYAEHIELSRVMFRATLFPEPDALAGIDDPLAPFLERVTGLFRAALARGELRRLPGDGSLAAQGFFAAYMAVLVAGLGGRLGVDARPDVTAQMWAVHLRALVRLQLEGMGAEPGAEGGTS